jgi:glycosyltransferase involved in cell wall biosynthesis
VAAPVAVTLIVPTYRRPEVVRCLDSIQQQRLPTFEVLLVDNAADDELKATVEAYNRTARVPVVYVAEPNLGLHNARHAGVRVATGDVLVFTDDDATFDPDWLAALAARFEEHPRMVAAGGPVRPIWETPPPAWLVDFMAGYPEMFPVLSLMEPYHAFRLGPDGWFFGVNMAIRRSVLVDLGGFNPDSFGSIWLGDGETGLNRRLWETGALIGYVPEAVVYHHVPPERMSPRYFRRRQANDGACDMYALYHRAGVPGPGGLLREAARIVARSARDWLAAPLLWDRTDPRALRVQMRAVRGLSQLQYVLRLLVDARLRVLVTRQNWLSAATGA